MKPPVRWTIAAACADFGVERKFLLRRIKTAGILPGPDNKYSTADIHRAIFGDMDAERLRKTTEEANAIALTNAVSRGDLIDKSDFLKRYETVYSGMRQRIMSSGMTDQEKDELLGDLQRLHSS